ncbi:MAG: indolepyruvate ferredoxin oxidoreductase family protein [Sphingomonadales bacterium]|nr:indolepyruvate ferredoxin oxidoreductase family protein [Sphingomonadales bacterium]
MTKSVVALDDKYQQEGGRVFMSSIQALVRLPLDQARRDKRAGKKTAGFISGYRGSPIGTYDAALWGAAHMLDEHDITFLPGLNEELAASSVRGTQELTWFGSSSREGIFSLWYGKGVGVDRGMEALKLANLEGSSPDGGVLVIAADDPGGKSSASAHQSEHTLIAAMIPILYPANAEEIIEYGLLGWEMSRYSGLYVALKCVTDNLDHSASVALPDAYRPFERPPGFSMPPEGLGLRQMRPPLAQEDWAINRRLPAAQAFARANGLDRTVLESEAAVLSIVAAGKTYLDVRQALDDLGIDEGNAPGLGIRLRKLGLVWPIDPEGMAAFAAGSRELLVIEEKRPVIEDQAAGVLLGLSNEQRPVLTGKRDPQGKTLLSSVGELSPSSVRRAIYARLNALGLATKSITERFEYFESASRRPEALPAATRIRPAFFCSGCPHNTGTRLPDGSVAISAVGCHGLAAFIPERRTMMPMPMGGDGMPWVAAGPFVDMPHIFQNMGDGTYAHSGILSIRAAVAARSRMTFKILYNDAVAMTGGQPVEGAPTPIEIVRQLLAERVAPVVIVTDEPTQFTGQDAPPDGVRVVHRDRLDEVQKELRDVPAVSAIVYVQTCAAEKRRRRKRGLYPDPDRRVVINPAVCEGCGDCSVQSNCLSVVPLETEFGRKRMIDQSSCNKDFSCLKGFCPSFITVDGAKLAKRGDTGASRFDAQIADLPEPKLAGVNGVYDVLVTGIGGTGVLTVGAVLGMAAHLEGKGCTVMDQTGMAQKGGAVTSHLRVAPGQDELFSPRLDVASADLILACDMVVAAYPDVLKTVKPGVTKAVLNRDVSPTGEFQTNRDLDLNPPQLEDIISAALAGGAAYGLNASKLATSLTGDSIATNFLMVGFALQKGLLPVSRGAIEEAIRLNGSNVSGNLRTLGLGRLAAERPEVFEAPEPDAEAIARLDTLQGVLDSRSELLTAYQDVSYAAEYRAFVEETAKVVDATGGPDTAGYVRAVALTLARLMAYKDEYEVARLHTDPRFKESLKTQFEDGFKLAFHLSPPILARTDPKTGRPQKMRFGQWIQKVFLVLGRMKGLRGTAFDPFGYTLERREERALIQEYKDLIRQISPKIKAHNMGQAVALAEAAAQIRGYGPVKQESIARYRVDLPILLAAFAQQAEPAEHPSLVNA